MAQQDEQRPIGFNTLKELLPFAILLVSVVLAWGSITTNQAVNGQKLDAMIAQETQLSERLTELQTAQSTQGTDIAVIKQILQHNNLSQGLPSENTLASAYPLMESITPVPTPLASTPQTPVFHQTIIVPSQAESPQPTPQAPAPDPTPVAFCVPLTNLCI